MKFPISNPIFRRERDEFKLAEEKDDRHCPGHLQPPGARIRRISES